MAMNEPPATPPPPPPPPRIFVLRTTSDILKKTTSIFCRRRNLDMFLFLSLSLSFQRFAVEIGTDFLSSFLDNDASIKPLVYRVYGPPDPTRRRHHRHCPFVQLSHIGFLENDDFRPGDVDFDHRFFNTQINSTLLVLDSFDPHPFLTNSAFSASYWIMVFKLVATYTKVHGIIFLIVVNDFCGRHNSFFFTIFNGLGLGVERLSGFIAIRWLVRYALTHLLGVWFFISIINPYSFLKVFIRYKFMPFSIMFPWVEGFEEEFYGFITSWVLLDFAMSHVIDMVAWIIMAGSRKNWRGLVKEGCHLLSLMIEPTINLKVLESIVCGRYGRSVLTRYFGELFALALVSFMEVYLMVAWMVYYLSVKAIDANSRGQPFGQRELEAMVED